MSLAEEYKKLVDEQMPKIDELLLQARKALDEATKLADTHGIPFYSTGISRVGQHYLPPSFSKINQAIQKEDEDFDIYDVLPDGIGEYEGWQASAICY